MKRRQSLEFSYEGIENHPSHHQKNELGNYSCKNSDFEVCSGNFYHMPQFVTTPGGTCGGGGGIPPKDRGLCDYYFTKPPDRSPLYGRTTAANNEDVSTPNGKSRNLHHRASEKKFSTPVLGVTGVKSCSGGNPTRRGPMTNANFLSDCSTSSIQRLRNDDSGVVGTECDSLFSVHDESIDELYGYYNLDCSASSATAANSSNIEGIVEAPLTKGSSESDEDKTKVEKETSTSSTSKKQKIEEKPPELPPPVIKKKAR